MLVYRFELVKDRENFVDRDYEKSAKEERRELEKKSKDKRRDDDRKVKNGDHWRYK